jgi:hypothetical protein
MLLDAFLERMAASLGKDSGEGSHHKNKESRISKPSSRRSRIRPRHQHDGENVAEEHQR